MPPRIPARTIASAPWISSSIASTSTSTSVPPIPRSTSPISPTCNRRNLHSNTSKLPSIDSTVSHKRCSPQVHTQTRSFHSTQGANASHKDPYNVLGVKKDAKAADIKKSYYQLAKKWHPDTNKDKNANERFMEIQAAYDILSDDNKRQAYDRYGSASTQEGFDPDGFARGGAGGFGGFQDFGGFGGGRPGSAGDLFEQLFGGAFGGGPGSTGGSPFGGGGPRARPTRGDDLETTVNLSFMEACNGVNRKINISPVVDCKPCTGSGLKPGQKKSTCPTCRGTGQQTFQVSGMYMASTCQSCGGAGSTISREARCNSCDGVGRVKERKEVEVEIPAGVEDGMKVKMSSLGDMPLSSNGPPGDLFIRVNVKPSTVFRRQGTTLYHDAKVPLHTALLGGRIRIPTLEGDVEVRVREGTQNGEEAVLKGRGVKSVYSMRGKGERGDLVVSWKIQIPRSLTTFQKKILQAFADDVEGRPTKISFEDTPKATPSTPPNQSSSPTTSTSSGTIPPKEKKGDYPSSPASSSSSPNPPPPFVETETLSPPNPQEEKSFGEKFAGAVGGAIGWMEGLFGSGDSGGKKGSPRR